jgi:hypothetical protein
MTMPFTLPPSTRVNIPVHKKELEDKLRGKHKKVLTEGIQRIDWLFKLSAETTNLPKADILEIQIMRVQLKKQESVLSTLVQLDKQIPYPIIWVQQFADQILLSTSAKHPHPLDESKMVIDHTFSSEWMHSESQGWELRLIGNLDEVYTRFCQSLTVNPAPTLNLADQIARTKEIAKLERQIQLLESKIKACKQFNRKVELNRELREVKKKLGELK